MRTIRGLPATLAATLIVGCASKTDADGTQRPDGGVETPSRTWFSSDSACQQCLDEWCFREVHACDEPQACTQSLSVYACKTACRDPVCAAGCESLSGSRTESDGLDSCVGYHCRDECFPPSARFDCVGKFHAPLAPAGDVPLALHFFDLLSGAPLPNLELRGCRSREGACDPLGNSTTGADGRATLTFPGSVIYQGAVEMHDPAGTYMDALLEGSILNRTRLGTEISDASLSLWKTLAPEIVGRLPDSSQGLVTILAVDCWARPAAGLTADSPSTDPSLLVTPTNGVGPRIAEQTDDNGLIIVGSPPGVVEVAVRDSGKTVAKERVVIRAGWLHWIVVVPRTIENVRDLGP